MLTVYYYIYTRGLRLIRIITVRSKLLKIKQLTSILNMKNLLVEEFEI